MEKRGAEEQREYARDLLICGEAEKPQQTETHQRGQKAHEDVRSVADHNTADGWVVIVVAQRG